MANTFPLRLSASSRRRAIDLANEEGISLNQFIVLATVEKIARLELLIERATKTNGHPPRSADAELQSAKRTSST